MPRKTAKGRRAEPPAIAPAPGPEPEFSPPRNPDELHAWLSTTLGLTIQRQAALPGHASPFDYLVHTFFEGRGRWVASEGPPAGALPEDLPGAPIDAVVWANRGGGKTFLGAVATMLDLVFKPGIEVRILGGSLEQASRMHRHLRGLFEREALAPFVSGRITERRIRLANRSSVELLAQSQVSVRGTRVQKLRCDEVELFDPLVWEAAQLTTRSRRCAGVWVHGAIECLSTMHVPHGVMARLVDEAQGGSRTIFKWGLIDVLSFCGPEHRCRGITPRGIAFPGDDSSPDPAPHSASPIPSSGKAMPHMPHLRSPCPLLPECAGSAKQRDGGHIPITDALRQKSRVSQAVWESEMLCLRPRRSGSVFTDFDPAAHVVSRLPWEPGEPAAWIGGMDFGYRNSVILWAGLAPDGAVCIVDERCSQNEILDAHIRAIRAGLGRWPALSWIGVDPAGEGRSDQTGEGSAEVLRRAGITVRLRHMGREMGLSLIRARLRPADGPPRLFIHERCRRLIECMEKYHYPADRPECMVPVKDGHDHAVDALRYLMCNLDRPYITRKGKYA